ncbi:endo alpha-1,4 polygalactosaminidase [Alsobacter sp. SYSU BS001988]
MAITSWAIQLQNAQPSEVKASSFDLAVVDRDWFDGAVTRSYSPTEVATMETAANGAGHRDVLAYMSIGQASTWRDYWNPAWDAAPPSWLGASDPNWPGSYSVHYWESGWQNLLFGSPGAYIDRILAAGFNGVFLDTVSIFHQYDNYAFTDGSGATSAQRMVDLVAQISRYAKSVDPQFEVFVNGAEDLLPNPTFMAAIDGINKESLYYGVPGLGVPNASDMVAYSAGLLDTAFEAGKLVLNIEYLNAEASITDVVTRDSGAHVLPYVTPQQGLNTLDFTGSTSGDVITAGAGRNHIYGLAGDDMIVAGAGDDWVYGGAGADRLDGGAGDDLLNGGSGADRFHFGPGATGKDVITDFERAVTGEVIEFSHGLIAGVSKFQNLKSHITENASHWAVIPLGNGDSITLQGVRKADLQADDFVFL